MIWGPLSDSSLVQTNFRFVIPVLGTASAATFRCEGA